eukprot:6194650-Pleurochrysis_carterae.AAC.7
MEGEENALAASARRNHMGANLSTRSTPSGSNRQSKQTASRSGYRRTYAAVANFLSFFSLQFSAIHPFCQKQGCASAASKPQPETEHRDARA